MSEAGDSQKKRFRLFEELPSFSVHHQRFRALHLVLGRMVEFRIAVAPDGEEVRSEEAAENPFRRELIAFSQVDDPVFPMILERARFQGRLYYVIPLREAPALLDLCESSEFSLPHRCQAIRSLAGGLSALHQKGILLHRFDPARLTWDPQRREVQFQSLLFDPPVASGALPEWSKDLPPMQRDVVAWGSLAYWLLSRGERTHAGQQYVPLGARVRRLHPGLAEVVDACLVRTGRERPGSGIELHALLGLRSLSVRERDPAALEEAPDYSVAESLVMMRESKALPKVGTFEVPKLLQLPELPELGLRMTEKMAWIQEISDQVRESWMETHRTGVLVLGVVVALVVAVLTWSLLPAEAPPRVVEPRAGSSDFSRDPYLKQFLELPQTSPESFESAWELAWSLVLQGRLPGARGASARLQALRKAYDADPEQGCRLFDEYREELGGQLGEAVRSAGSPD